MKLLFDQNISFKVKKQIKEYFPDSAHISDFKLEKSGDYNIWIFAKENNYAILTYDSDFIDLSNLYGFPPKIIIQQFGNASTIEISNRLIKEKDTIIQFLESPEIAFLGVV